MRAGPIDLIFTGKRVIKEIDEDDVIELAAALAYRFFLALFPFFIFLAALGGFIAPLLDIQNPAQQVVGVLGDTLPPNAADLIQPELEKVTGSRHPGLLSLGIIGAIWIATTGIAAVIKAMNRAYDVPETRPFWKRYLVALGLTLLAGVVTIATFVLFVVGQFVGPQLLSALGLESASGLLITVARWGLAVLLMLVAVSLIYWLAPNIHLPFKWITPGAVLFAIAWVIATYLFSLFVTNFGTYGATYGTLGGVAVLLLWFYLTAFILLVGAEINAVIDTQVDPEQVETQRRQRQQEEAARRARQDERRVPAG